ncbi:hypothetical protein CsSME_00010512 [Camellia sinensis var. sinensis]
MKFIVTFHRCKDGLLVKAECEVIHGKPVPTLWNFSRAFFL